MIKIMYVDDSIDLAITECLFEFSTNNPDIEYTEEVFTIEKNYEDLIKIVKEENVNILIIDSKLYTTDSKGKKYTGEEFRIILKIFFPFIETLVVTQNDISGPEIIKKYDSEAHKEMKINQYYNQVLIEEIKNKKLKIESSRNLLKKIELNETLDENIIQKLALSLSNDDSYKELKVEDINKLIENFNELKRLIENGSK